MDIQDEKQPHIVPSIKPVDPVIISRSKKFPEKTIDLVQCAADQMMLFTSKSKKKLKIPRDASILTVLKNAQQHIVGAATNWLKAFVSDNLLKWTSSTCKFEENHFSFPKTWLLLGKMSSTRCEAGGVSFQGRLPNENWQLVQRVSSVNRSKAFPRLKNSSISQSHKSILEKSKYDFLKLATSF